MPYYYRRKKKKEEDYSGIPRVKVVKKPNYIDQLDRIFSLYIRLRDAMYGGYTRCISCGRVLEFDKFDAGHFHSRTHKATRWDEDNVHSECQACNRFSADHLIQYRENLIRKIGEDRYKLLEVKAHTISKDYDEFALKALIADYKKKVKQLAQEKGINVKC